MSPDPAREESSRDGEAPGERTPGLMRSLGRGAGRATRALARLGRKGATALAVSRLRAESRRLTAELGELARRTLTEGKPLHSTDQPASDLLKALGRIDERIRRLEAEAARQENDSANPPGNR